MTACECMVIQLVHGSVKKALTRAVERCRELAERTAGGDATRPKIDRGMRKIWAFRGEYWCHKLEGKLN